MIVTASIGVLQSGKIEFSPPLPKWKQDAISCFGMADFNKVFIRWDEQWWLDSDFDKSQFTMAVDDSQKREQWIGFTHPHPDHPILQFFVIDEESRRVS